MEEEEEESRQKEHALQVKEPERVTQSSFEEDLNELRLKHREMLGLSENSREPQSASRAAWR